MRSINQIIQDLAKNSDEYRRTEDIACHAICAGMDSVNQEEYWIHCDDLAEEKKRLEIELMDALLEKHGQDEKLEEFRKRYSDWWNKEKSRLENIIYQLRIRILAGNNPRNPVATCSFCPNEKFKSEPCKLAKLEFDPRFGATHFPDCEKCWKDFIDRMEP